MTEMIKITKANYQRSKSMLVRLANDKNRVTIREGDTVIFYCARLSVEYLVSLLFVFRNKP